MADIDTPPSDARLRAYLASLPAPAAPPIAERILGLHRRRQRRRRLAWVGSAAACALAVAVVLPLVQQTAPAAGDLSAEATAPPQAVPTPAALRQLDRALQAAYARDADPAELEALWRAREAALAAADAVPPAPVRI
ncbi:hypothetical protein [Coralloluteibacterium thermophilus]|uniref:Anti-sigma factor n=1 Tax=Coralloluteibacterium thermophilum TaxID=2707049 RepID=A0ABV9NLZ7_9GAMM